MDNNNRAAHGRFLNVKPAVGLLTSTARTFIQEGVTTEYATQVLGTKLDNGLYAQLLTKSSRVVYSNSNINANDDSLQTTATILYNQIIPTQLIGKLTSIVSSSIQSRQNIDHDSNTNKISYFSNGTNKIDDHNIITFIKNTDYVSPSNPTKNVQLATNVNNLAPEDAEFEMLPQSLAQVLNPVNEELTQVRQSFSVSESSSSSTRAKTNDEKLEKKDGKSLQVSKILVKPDSVKPADELPTFTIPSGFSFDGIENVDIYGQSEYANSNEPEDENSFSRSPQADDIQKNRIGKQYRGEVSVIGLTEEMKHLTSVTYYGFADFTTIVGNTVIVFSPSTAPPTIGQVTSIKGEATLYQSSKADISAELKPTQTVNKYPILQTQRTEHILNGVDKSVRKDKADEILTTTEQITITESEEIDEEPTISSVESVTITDEEQSVEELEQKSIILAKEQNTLKYDLQPSVIDPSDSHITSSIEKEIQTNNQIVSEATVSNTPPIMLSIPSNDDISKIFASLAAKDKSQLDDSQSLETAETFKVSGGATTIFFEDDPFALIESSTPNAEINPSTTTVSAQTEAYAENNQYDETTEESSTTIDTNTVKESTENSNDEENDDTTTEGQNDFTTTEAINRNYDDDNNENQNRSEELNENDESRCPEGYTVKPSTSYKTLKYLTTFFIPADDEEDSTTTSIQSNDVTQTDVSFMCSQTVKIAEIKPTSVIEQPITTKTNLNVLNQNEKTTEKPSSKETVKNLQKISLRNKLLNRTKATTSTPIIATTSEESTTEQIFEQINGNDGSNIIKSEQQSNDDQFEAVTLSTMSTTTTESTNDFDEDGIELIYKTLYTTYTYLTTFFHESTSSISQRKEVVTNVVTSTLDMSLIKSDAALADLVASMSVEQTAIQPTKSSPLLKSTIDTDSLKKVSPISIEDIFGDSIVESNVNQATPVLNDSIKGTKIDGSELKTYYTTYTYFTTIFVDGETEIASRTEVYTNFVGQSVKPTQLVEEDKIFSTKKISEAEVKKVKEEADDLLDNNVIQPSYSIMSRATESPNTSNLVSNEDDVTTTESTLDETEESSTISVTKSNSTMTTEVKNSSSSSSSTKDVKRVVDNIRKQLNNLLEDQISSESNNQEILPSSTLLLQTSFTTYTYYTTMYNGDSSQIQSRLETVTNVVTHNISPTQTIVLPVISDDPVLPTTYFTTFTYWTTLYNKEGSAFTTSREKIVSNVVSPTAMLPIEESVPNTRIALVEAESVTDEPSEILENDMLTTTENSPENLIESSMIEAPVSASAINDKRTTYYTTYTYYTTSYVNDETVLNSRFETITNVVEPSALPTIITPIGRAINLDKANINHLKNEKTLKKGSLKEQDTFSTNDKLKPEQADVVSINFGKIVDAEGISTIFYTTKAIGTYIDNVYSQITDKTTSVYIDESKKKALLDATPSLADNKHKTGLVRLIDGTMIVNHTKTLYQSKVIGTIIDNRYAQIIESTSSYVIEKTQEPGIAPTATLEIKSTQAVISPSSAVIESSLSDLVSQIDGENDEGYGDENEENDEEESNDENDENGRKKSRLTFSTKKRTFTPIIRPFASRNRPTFSPKRKNLAPSSATIITSDFTPTITATPAIKTDTSSRRFSGNARRSSNNPAAPSSATPSLSGSKRFSRLRTSSLLNSSIGPSSSARIRPSSTRGFQSTFGSSLGSSRRIGNLFRSSTLPAGRLNILPSQVRFRSNPTLSSALRDNQAAVTTKPDQSEDATTVDSVENPETDKEIDEDEESTQTTTTENSRRNQNPLLRFRRPLTSSTSRFQPNSTLSNSPRSQVVTVTTRKSPLARKSVQKSTTTTTTTTPKPKNRSFQKPPGLAALVQHSANRQRVSSKGATSNNLFPSRAFFKPTAAVNQDLEKNDNNDTNDQPDNLEPNEENEDENIDETDDINVESEYETPIRRESVALTPQSALRIRKRTKRSPQSDFGTRTLSRYRRPPQNQTPQISARSFDESYVDIEYQKTQRPKSNSQGNSRYQSRYRPSNVETSEAEHYQVPTPNTRIRPTNTKQSRSQFTLRSSVEKDNNYTPANTRASNFRRTQNIGANSNGYTQTTSTRRKPLSTSSTRSKTSRLRNYGGTYDTRNSNSRSPNRSSNSRGTTRNSSRSRSRVSQDIIDYEFIPNFDGTITVTHQIPVEATIPIVNGKNTEYKNVITAKISTEVIGPNQYITTTRNNNGNSVLLLTSEATSIVNGVTEVTQFLLKETPTTSITFTPTLIRGRKTSFSHIVPSTVYNVEPIVSTIQPQISANAPLANILLSQLLLGNLALPQQQLLGGLQPQLNGVNMIATTPSTEYRTRTTTYVTTVTNAMSTVLPLTFRGKEITTTIVDSSIDVITATELLTETIIVTPTATQPQQINSLILPLLLQQQAQQQSQQQQLAQVQQPLNIPLNFPQSEMIDTGAAQSLLQDSLLTLDDSDQQTFADNKSGKKLDIDDNDAEIRNDYPDLDENENTERQQKIVKPPYAFNNAASNQNNKRPKITKPKRLETSIITLYVSGRKPGEFSTTLSTVITTPDAGYTLLQKRAANDEIVAGASYLPDFYDVYKAEGSDIDEVFIPAATTNELSIESSQSNSGNLNDVAETQSLESILGDVSNYVNSYSTKSFLY